MKAFLKCLVVVMLLSGCSMSRKSSDSGHIVVSIPAVAYFAERLTAGQAKVHVMIPQSVGHSDYMLSVKDVVVLESAELYLALGSLDFELQQRDKFKMYSPDMIWAELGDSIPLLVGGCSHSHNHDCSAHNVADPHYWLSPLQAKQLTLNMAKHIRKVMPELTQVVDSSLQTLLVDIQKWHDKFESLAQSGRTKAFMMYHPSLSYLARDYNMRQFAIEKNGNAPSPKSMIEEIDSAKADGVSVVFVQRGYDMQKAAVAAQQLRATLIEIDPTGYDWEQTMSTIFNALQK